MSNRWTYAGVATISGALFVGGTAGANRVLASGELPTGGGTGDATRTSPNYFTALNVFAGQTIISGGMVTAGDVQISGATLLAYGPLFQGNLGGGARYITSGELSAAGGGDAFRGQTNYWAGPNVFGGTLAASGSTVIGGGLQISGGNPITYVPIYANVVTAAARLVTSGELPSGKLVRVIDSAANPIDITGSTGTFQVYTYNVPANTLLSGERLSLELDGHVQNFSGLSRDFIVIAQFGGITIYSGMAQAVGTGSRGPMTLVIHFNAIHPLNQQIVASWDMATSTSQVIMSGISNPNTTTSSNRMVAYADTAIDGGQQQTLIVSFRVTDSNMSMHRRMVKMVLYP